MKPEAIRLMKQVDCQVYLKDLSRKPMDWQEILEATENPKGFDITSSEALDPATRFYDWLSYEIINSSPYYCFIPFGTGNLFENVLNIAKREVTSKKHDPRFHGQIQKLRLCNYMGATTNNRSSKAIKLYSAHLPFKHYDEQWIRLYRYAGYCGSESNVYNLQEPYLNRAMDIAQKQNIQCEYSGIAGLALMLQMAKQLDKRKKILIVNTGKTHLLSH